MCLQHGVGRTSKTQAARDVASAGDVSDSEPIDPLDFLARVLIHIPETNKHLVHFYGAYANRSRSSMPHGRDSEQNKGEGDGELSLRPYRYYSRSKRSRVTTLVHASTKSCTNFSCASSAA